MSAVLECHPALVLNADFRPLSYFPLSLWCWQDTIKAVFMGRVNVVDEYDQAVHSPSFEMPLPSVISLIDYVSMVKKPAFTRFNVFLRDSFSCQYCGHSFPSENLTFDHVIPRARGGTTLWGDVVTACAPCNLAIGHQFFREAQMHPLTKPRQPTAWQLQENGRSFPPGRLHKSWHDFLYWDAELLQD